MRSFLNKIVCTVELSQKPCVVTRCIESGPMEDGAFEADIRVLIGEDEHFISIPYSGRISDVNLSRMLLDAVANKTGRAVRPVAW